MKYENLDNTEIRISNHDTLSEYKYLLRTKQQNYKNEKMRQLTKSQDCSQSFWNVFKTLPANVSSETLPLVKETEWLQHFEIYVQPRKCKVKIKIQY